MGNPPQGTAPVSHDPANPQGAYGAAPPNPNPAGQQMHGSGTASHSNPAGPGHGGPAPDYSMLNPNMPNTGGQTQGQPAPQGGYPQGQYQQ